MNIDIIAVGKIKEKYFTQAVEEYQKRLSRFVKFTVTEIPDEKIPDNASEKQELQILEREGDKILSKIKEGFVVAMCVEGVQKESTEIADFLMKTSMSHSRITFIIGGSLGLNQKLLNLAKQKICFSKMTFPHQLIRIFLLEQLFRAFKISNNETYHW